MTGLIDWALTRSRMILAFVVLSVIAGVTAYQNLPKEGTPNIDIPILYVSVGLNGVSAEDSERLLVKPLEKELRDLEGLKEMTAIASEGHAGVVLEFDFGWDKTATLATARDRVDRARAEMPDDVEEPTINEVNLSTVPILVVSISGSAPERTLLRVAKDLQRRIEGLTPVLEAPLAGHRDEMFEVVIDPLKLEAYGVAADELARVVSANNQLVAAGELDTGEGKFPLRVPGSIETVADAYTLPIKVSGDRVVTLGDLATITRTFEDATGAARFDGEKTIAIQVKKRIGQNIIETVDQVRAEVAAARADWPEPLRAAISVDFSLDQSIQVVSMVSQLESSVLTAILLVMIVVLSALGLRSALLVGLAVPCSFLLSFALMAVMGLSVSNMVMFGLILAVGMLVDGAIVVAEYAERRMSEGAAPSAAYGEAARRMFWPIVSSTATTLCAFLPMLLWPGIPGQFMRNLPITLIFVLSASLLVALIYVPVVGAVVGAAIARLGEALGRIASRLGFRPRAASALRAAHAEGRRPRPLVGRAVEAIVRTPAAPFAVIGLAFMTVWGAFALYGAYGAGTEFFVKTEPERAIVHVRARGNLSLEQQDALVRQVEDRVRGVDGVGAVFAFTGTASLEQEGGDGPPDAVGQVQFELTDWRERLLRAEPRFGDAVLAEIEARVRGVPGAIPELAKVEDGPEQGKDVQIQLSSPNWEALLAATAAARNRLEATEGVTAVDDTRPQPGIEWRLSVDRTAAGRYGADVASVGAVVRLVSRGVVLDTVTPSDSDEELDIILRFPQAARTLSTLDALRLSTPEGMIPLSNFVTREPAPKLDEIARKDGERYFLVRANVALEENANAKIAELQTWIDDNPALFRGVNAAFVGDQEEQAESMAFLGAAFLGALGLMFVILLAQFNSFYNAVLVLSAVVMSVAGVMIGMLLRDQTFSIIMTGTGIVALAGIVVNNNIVLIDTYQEYARRMPRLDAIVRTVEDRLRPVLLTTITTIAGLLPMMFATSIDFVNREISVGAPTALWWVQLATAVVFGLGFSTMLTLLVTPAALAARVWVEIGAGRLWDALVPPEAQPHASTGSDLAEATLAEATLAEETLAEATRDARGAEKKALEIAAE
ncbi:MAG: efflux RND transporter permease subunit [Pseudomonadota bacterium]